MFSKQVIRINIKSIDVDQIKTISIPIVNFANKHDIAFDLSFNINNELIATYEAEGYTKAYCKGMVAEIKQMIKDTFKCKLDILLDIC